MNDNALQNLDFLIDYLDNQSSSSESETGLINDNQTVSNDANDENETGPSDHNSNGGHRDNNPINLTRRSSSVLHRYISSSSAKKRQVKDSNCKFCRSDVSRDSMANHLDNSEVCSTLYQRLHHVKSNIAALVCMYRCLYCDKNFQQFSNHLQTEPDCLRQYLTNFEVETLRYCNNYIIMI